MPTPIPTASDISINEVCEIFTIFGSRLTEAQRSINRLSERLAAKYISKEKILVIQEILEDLFNCFTDEFAEFTSLNHLENNGNSVVIMMVTNNHFVLNGNLIQKIKIIFDSFRIYFFVC